jgi:hypothetical protein
MSTPAGSGPSWESLLDDVRDVVKATAISAAQMAGSSHGGPLVGALAGVAVQKLLRAAQGQDQPASRAPGSIGDQFRDLHEPKLAAFRTAQLHLEEAGRQAAKGQDNSAELDHARVFLFQAFAAADSGVWRLWTAWQLATVYALAGDEEQAVRWVREAELVGKAELNDQCTALSVELRSVLRRSTAPRQDMWQRLVAGGFLIEVTSRPEATRHPLVKASRPKKTALAQDGTFLSHAMEISALGALVDGLADLRANKTDSRWTLSFAEAIRGAELPTDADGNLVLMTPEESLRDHRRELAAEGRRWTVTVAADSPLSHPGQIPERTIPAFRSPPESWGPGGPPWLHFTDWADGIDIALLSYRLATEWRTRPHR